MAQSPQDQSPPAETMDEALSHRANELYHDLQAGEFDRVHRRRHEIERVFWRRDVAPRLARIGSGFGVDLCTGTGFVPGVLLAELGASVRILCGDVSAQALERTRERLSPFAAQLSFHAGDAAAIPIADASAGWVTLNAGLHHVPQPAAVLGEIARVLKPGGLFCLGHEPNAAFFSSRFLHGLERLIWHGFWYLSPSRNLKRVRRRLGRAVDEYETHEHLSAINEALAGEGLIDRPLTPAELRKLIDAHTHDDAAGGKAGFFPKELIARHFADWGVEAMRFADYGGEMLQAHRRLRGGLDAMMRAVAPGKGRLFSWILRKRGPQTS